MCVCVCMRVCVRACVCARMFEYILDMVEDAQVLLDIRISKLCFVVTSLWSDCTESTLCQIFFFKSLAACDICGDTAATLWCRLCDNKQLCNACDEMWHRHPKRQNHEREPITSLPSPSTAQVPDAILGPFGIRAVHSLRLVWGHGAYELFA